MNKKLLLTITALLSFTPFCFGAAATKPKETYPLTIHYHTIEPNYVDEETFNEQKPLKDQDALPEGDTTFSILKKSMNEDYQAFVYLDQNPSKLKLIQINAVYVCFKEGKRFIIRSEGDYDKITDVTINNDGTVATVYQSGRRAINKLFIGEEEVDK